jgi:hypothetical protein
VVATSSPRTLGTRCQSCCIPEDFSIMKPMWCTFHSIYWESKAVAWLQKLQLCHSHLTYAHSIPNAVCSASTEDEQVMLETCRGLWFSINWMKSASRWFHYTDILWCTVNKTLNLSQEIVMYAKLYRTCFALTYKFMPMHFVFLYSVFNDAVSSAD